MAAAVLEKKNTLDAREVLKQVSLILRGCSLYVIEWFQVNCQVYYLHRVKTLSHKFQLW